MPTVYLELSGCLLIIQGGGLLRWYSGRESACQRMRFKRRGSSLSWEIHLENTWESLGGHTVSDLPSACNSVYLLFKSLDRVQLFFQPMDGTLPSSSIHGVGCYFFFQAILGKYLRNTLELEDTNVCYLQFYCPSLTVTKSGCLQQKDLN